MNKTVIATLAAAMFALPLAAQSAPGQGRDCATAPDPARCETMQKARRECAGKQRAERRDCMADRLPPPDCAKAPDPARCEARTAARAACKDKAGKQRRQCMRDHLPPPTGK